MDPREGRESSYAFVQIENLSGSQTPAYGKPNGLSVDKLGVSMKSPVYQLINCKFCGYVCVYVCMCVCMNMHVGCECNVVIATCPQRYLESRGRYRIWERGGGVRVTVKYYIARARRFSPLYEV